MYVDGVPAQVVELMENMYQNYKGQFTDLHVYVVSNLGFFDSKQIRNQLNIVKNWCHKMGMIYGGGIAIGAGGMLGKMPTDQGPGKNLGVGMKKIAEVISKRESMEDIYIEPAYFPRVFYLIVVNMGWSVDAKKNGLTRKELYRRLHGGKVTRVGLR